MKILWVEHCDVLKDIFYTPEADENQYYQKESVLLVGPGLMYSLDWPAARMNEHNVCFAYSRVESFNKLHMT